MKLIPNWKRGHKMWSVRLCAVAAFLSGLNEIFSKIMEVMPDNQMLKTASLICVVGAMFARLVDQPEVKSDDPTKRS